MGRAYSPAGAAAGNMSKESTTGERRPVPPIAASAGDAPRYSRIEGVSREPTAGSVQRDDERLAAQVDLDHT